MNIERKALYKALTARDPRFDGVFFLDFPGREQKQAIWSIYLDLFEIDRHLEAFITLGKKVHIITSSLFIGAELGPTQDLYLTRQRLLQKGVTFTPDIAVIEATRSACYSVRPRRRARVPSANAPNRPASIAARACRIRSR